MFRKDRNKNGGGLLFYVNQDLNCKTVNTYNFPADIEIAPALTTCSTCINKKKMAHFRFI